MSEPNENVLDVEGEEVTTTRAANVADLVPFEHSALVRPAGTPNEIAQVFTDYQELCKRLLDDQDYQSIGGKRFPKRSAWRKLAVAFGVTFTILERTISRDEEGRVQWAEFVVRALSPGGRHADGWGSCSLRGEDRRFSKPDHDIPATAETRAKNRAAADLFGMGDVSAEEIEAREQASRFTDETVARSKAVRERVSSLSETERGIFNGYVHKLDGIVYEKGYGWDESSLDHLEATLTLIEHASPETGEVRTPSTDPERQPDLHAVEDAAAEPDLHVPSTVGELHDIFLAQQAALAAGQTLTCPCGDTIAEDAAVHESENGIVYHEKCKPF